MCKRLDLVCTAVCPVSCLERKWAYAGEGGWEQPELWGSVACPGLCLEQAPVGDVPGLML